MAEETSPPPYDTPPSPAPSQLLEPSLKLDPSTIQSNLHKSDKAFAREVVKLIGERAENGIFARDCWGYKFYDPPVPSPFSRLIQTEPRPYLKCTGWDDLIGYNAYSYKKRLHKVADLAKLDLERRGIGVETLNIYVSERGIYCSWALVVPED